MIDPTKLTPEQWARLDALCDEMLEPDDGYARGAALPFPLPTLTEMEEQARVLDPVEIEEEVRQALLDLLNDPDEDPATRNEVDRVLRERGQSVQRPWTVPRTKLGTIARARTSFAAGSEEVWEEVIEGNGCRFCITGREQELGCLVMTVRVIESRVAILPRWKLRLPCAKNVRPIEEDLSWDRLGEQWMAQFVLTAAQREQLSDNPIPEIAPPESEP